MVIRCFALASSFLSFCSSDLSPHLLRHICLKNLDSAADGNSPPPMQNCRLHPLIHTFPRKELAQNVVGNPNEAECGLKYVIFSPT